MTIGIAAWGPNAGMAVLLGLQAVERVGSGAIGGFVSWVAPQVDASGPVWRAAVQRGGTAGLFGGAGLAAMPAAFAAARCAGVMSSGPDRPEPLAQFTPARSGVGLVTGHRFPNLGVGPGPAFNQDLLDAMARGDAPDVALAARLGLWPEADAGLVALGVDGQHAIGNTAAVLRRKDLGSAVRGSREDGALVLVIHNAIVPRDSLAAMASEVTWNAMHNVPVSRWVTLSAGVPLRRASRPAVWIDAAGNVTHVDIFGTAPTDRRSIGLGDEVAVLSSDGRPFGRLGYEPCLVVEDERVLSADGLPSLLLPVSQAT